MACVDPAAADRRGAAHAQLITMRPAARD
jgi:hypothetical protein